MNPATCRMAAEVDDFTDPWVPADVVILQHGFCRSARLWQGWVPYLARRHRVVRTDLVGCGRADKPDPDFTYTDEVIAEQFAELLDRLEIDSFHWVGEGVGAVLGAMVALERPGALRSLVGLSVPAMLDPAIQKNHQMSYGSMEEAVDELGMRGWWLAARAASGDLSDPVVDEAIADEVALTPPHAAVALSRWTVTWRFDDLLARLDAPVLLAWAENGRFVPAEERDRLTGLAADGRQWLIPGTRSQMFPYTQVDAVAPTVAAFIDDATLRWSNDR